MPASRLSRIVAAAALVLIAVVLAGRVRLDDDMTRVLPDTNRDLERGVRALTRLLERFVIDIEAPEGHAMEPAELGRTGDILGARLLESGCVASVRSAVSAADALALAETLRERAARLVRPEALAELKRQLTPDAVKTTIESLARRLQEPEGAYLAARAANDPLGVSDRALAPLATLAGGVIDAEWRADRLVSKDGRHVLVIVEPGFRPTDLAKSRALIDAVERGIEALRAEPAFAGVTVRYLGSHRSTLDNAEQIRRDVVRTSGLGVVLLLALVIVTFRRFWLGLLALLPAFFGGAAALAAFACVRDSVPAFVAGFGAVFLGTTVDYATHILFRVDRAQGRPQLPLAELCLGTVTTSIAFLALLFSALPSVRDIGAIGAMGTVAAVLFAVAFLPALAGSAGAARRPLVDLAAFVARVATPRARRIAALVALVLTPVIAHGVRYVRFDGEVGRLSSLSPDTRAAEAAIEHAWGDTFRFTLLAVQGRTLQEALQANDRLGTALEALRAKGTIRAHASLAGLLPSQAVQDENLRAWRSFWDPARLEALRADLARAVADTPFRADAFEPFFAWVTTDPPAIGLETLRGTALSGLYEDRLFEKDGRWVAASPVLLRDPSALQEVKEALARDVPEAAIVNRDQLVRTIAGMVEGEVWKLGAIALGAVAVVVFLWLSRLMLAWLVLLPLLASCVWTVGLLGWFGVPVTLANAIFVALMFAAAMDYAIFTAGSRLERFRGSDDPTNANDASVLLCALANGLGFGTLALAGHPVLNSIGVTALTGLTCAFASTMLFTPLLAAVVLGGSGRYGAPGVRNLLATCWGLGGMAIMVAAYAVFRRPFLPPERRGRAALELAQRAGVWVRDRFPMGRRMYLGATAEKFRTPCIIVSNHESNFDGLCLHALPVPIRILAKPRIRKEPLFGLIAEDAGYIIPQDLPLAELVAQVRSSLAQGVCVLIFPEGTRTKTGLVGRFHVGAFAMARALGTKVLPVALVNTRSILRPSTWWAGDHDLRVEVLEPMDPAAFTGEMADRAMARECRARIVAARDRLWPETQDGSEWHRPLAAAYRYLGPIVERYAAAKAKYDPLVRALPRLCDGEGTVLAAGCGYGLCTARLAAWYPGRPIRAVDLDEHKLRVARTAVGRLGAAEFVRGDVRTVDLGSPQTALLVDVLHYWRDEEQREILGAVVRSLAPGGKLVFRDGCAGRSWGHVLERAVELFAGGIRFTRAGTGLWYRDLAGWCRLLREHGLDIEEVREDLGRFSSCVVVCRKRAEAAHAPRDAA